MRKDGLDFFSMNPRSLDVHEARVHPKSYAKLTCLSFARTVFVMGVAGLVIFLAKGKEGTLKAEY